MRSYESVFAMDSVYASEMPINQVLAAQRIVDTEKALAQVNEHLSFSPLRRKVMVPAPKLKRNYGSLDLNRAMSTSSSDSSVVTTPTDTSFPTHYVQWNEDEGEVIEQDDTPLSSAPASPMLEFSTRQNHSHKAVASCQEPQPFGVMFGPNSTPELVSANEIADYLDFLDVLEDYDSLEQFAEAGMLGSASCLDPNATKFSPARVHRSVHRAHLDSTPSQWNLNHSSLASTPEKTSSATVIELNHTGLSTVNSLLASPKLLFEPASPQISRGAWRLPGPTLDSAFDTQVASPSTGTAWSETLPWISAILSLALIANMMMGRAY
ncbi:hypothetical protein RHS04_00213 [Rhizoctonia solani]|uniref:Uncharacterized protein n=1 Tax=Rhizoctonia solani TaxID=456999 RepID=A0A8H7HIZ1_9AGAM|nr:hypothetical protein RHS04_00213 [Rhizoctonia solani]